MFSGAEKQYRSFFFSSVKAKIRSLIYMSVNTQENIFLFKLYISWARSQVFLVLNMTERNTFGGMRNHGYILHRQKGNRSAGMEERILLPEVYCLISPELFPFEVDEHV
jgi:hypothetical protein